MELGANIKRLRGELGLTLEALSERSGVSRAMLSDIERGVKSPTIRVVSQVAEGLGSSVSRLLGEDAGQGQDALQVLRRDERQVLVDPKSGVERHLLSPRFLRRGIELVWYTLPPGQATGTFPPHRPGTEEHITVVRGTLRCRIGESEATLQEGDSLSFRADFEHAFENAGSDECGYFLVIDSSSAR
jgi:transcriptional regulator with XRE-family HTH domain